MKIERFYEKLEAKASGCIEYTGRMPRAYAPVNIEGFIIDAHRLVWALHHGELPKGLQVAHKCDNPPCCNLDHLFLATPRENYEDMVRKGRASWQIYESVC